MHVEYCCNNVSLLKRLLLISMLSLSCGKAGGSEIPDRFSARGGTEDGSEEWGYIPVRPGASMFYWFYRTTHPDGYHNKPIVLWLQGGPGASGIGIGNFLEFGPLDEKLKPRNTTWIQTANILFTDNPIHTGFSVAQNGTIPTTIEEISADLIKILKTFMEEHSYFKSNPFYIFGQSYGGKMAAALTYFLNKAIGDGEIQCNLKGAGIGNGFVSPTDMLVSWPAIMYEMSLVDHVQHKELSDEVWELYWAGEAQNWTAVGKGFVDLQHTISPYVPNMSYYKITDVILPSEEWGLVYDAEIDDFMNGAVKEKLGIIPHEKTWKLWDRAVWDAVVDFGKPAWHFVDDLLKSSDLDIVVYSGQLDIMCSTYGALRWMNKLTWKGKEDYEKAERKTLTNPDTNVPEMFVKSHDHLKMYWVLNSGHVVPTDVPDVAFRMLNRILDNVD